jgi:chromosome segregation ATPase
MASKALNINATTQDSAIAGLEIQNEKLREEIRTIKLISNSQLKELQEKSQEQLNVLNNTIQNLESSIKQLSEENSLLKEHLRNADRKLSRLGKVNEELSLSMENEMEISEVLNSTEEYQYQINLMNEKIKRQNALLKAEKLKTVDAVREKTEILELCDLEKKNYEKKIKALQEEIETLSGKLQVSKDFSETKPKNSDVDSQNLIALSEHLQAKQRTIESLINEKSNLVLMLEKEVSFT